MTDGHVPKGYTNGREWALAEMVTALEALILAIDPKLFSFIPEMEPKARAKILSHEDVVMIYYRTNYLRGCRVGFLRDNRAAEGDK